MAETNPQAVLLNNTIMADNPGLFAMLSARGRAVYYPVQGILGQTAEAKGKRLNATIGIAFDDDRTPLRLPCIEQHLRLSPEEVFPYAPSFGLPELRKSWRQQLLRKNPSLAGIRFSEPVVTQALTHGLSIAAYLFVDADDVILSPDRFWGNYRLIFETGCGAEWCTYRTFAGEGLDLAALRDAVTRGGPAKRIVCLNFPNNPTGYTPTEAEAEEMVRILTEAAEAGNDVVALIDDAYFGLVYESGIISESVFCRLAAAHPRILAVKIDGPTKEDYVWGLRVGFLTFAAADMSTPTAEALAAKAAGAVRGTVSNVSRLSQSLLLRAYADPDYTAQKRVKYETLQRRYRRIREILAGHPHYAEAFTPLPFNSGYFMCVEPNADPERVRRILLDEFSTGVIAVAGVIRIAYSSVPCDQLGELFESLYQACCKAR